MIPEPTPYTAKDFLFETLIIFYYGPQILCVKACNSFRAMMDEPRADQDGF